MSTFCDGGMVQFQASPSGICDGQSVCETQCSLGIIPAMFLTHFNLFTIGAIYNVSG